MERTSKDKSVDFGLLKRVITPNEHCSSVQIPKEWFGRMVEVILFPLPSNAETAPQPNPMPFKVNRSRLESMRVSSTPGLLSNELIRADRDARQTVMYLDSAIIVKLSVAELDSEFYAALVDGRTDLSASALSLPECRSALARKADGGEISQNEYVEAYEAVGDMLSGHSGIAVMNVENETLVLASTIIEKCRGKAVLRTLDAIHIATCIRAGAYPIVTNDKTMRKAAEVLDVALAPLPTQI